ncbi:hypothetical protein KQX54_004600 [Cotesia glomerata]|uniref:Uncharacterized protein n=1 Tax=Cotesia glomerata TaxID=32391 RepID=A0AAV7INF6_COTGL|nr:hypothetical protein KQX54_004600 [Cotesia glomerata]
MTAMPRCACENHCAVLMANYWMRRKPLGIHPLMPLEPEVECKQMREGGSESGKKSSPPSPPGHPWGFDLRRSSC